MKAALQLPPEQENSFAWFGDDMVTREDEWISMLTPDDIAELEIAGERAAMSGKKLEEITAEDFPLPTLSSKLVEISGEITKGRGFALLRGLPVGRYSEQESSTIFYGLGTHLGSARTQNAQGHLLGHVRDLGMKSDDPNVRIYQTRERQTFHTDSADVVGLLCLQEAKSGGRSLLCSSTTIFNEMLSTRPDLLAVLFGPIATDRRGEIPPGMLPYFLIPVFTFYEGALTAIYQRQYIDSAQRFPDAPRLTEHHIEALNMFDALANSPRIHFSMKLERGDMQFVYNHTILHDRTAFEDFSDDALKRHLLRLWLAVPGDRPLPEIFATKFGKRYS